MSHKIHKSKESSDKTDYVWWNLNKQEYDDRTWFLRLKGKVSRESTCQILCVSVFKVNRITSLSRRPQLSKTIYPSESKRALPPHSTSWRAQRPRCPHGGPPEYQILKHRRAFEDESVWNPQEVQNKRKMTATGSASLHRFPADD